MDVAKITSITFDIFVFAKASYLACLVRLTSVVTVTAAMEPTSDGINWGSATPKPGCFLYISNS